MVEVLRTTSPVARVEHKCQTCDGAIAPGEKYERQVCAYDGRIYDWVTCPACIALFPTVWEWVDGASWDEGIGQEDYDEWARAFEDDQSRNGYLARAYLARRSAARESHDSAATE